MTDCTEFALHLLSCQTVLQCFWLQGGMKAVMYTDLIQIVIMFGGMITILIKGSIDVGGFDEVWRRAGAGDRLELFKYCSA